MLEGQEAGANALDSDEDVKLVAADYEVVPSVELTSDFPRFDGLLSDRTSQLAAYRRRDRQ
jgi:hypothetical protein